jgi:hypothetical protein
MAWIVEDVIRRRHLNDFSGMQNCNPMAKPGNRQQIVRDE